MQDACEEIFLTNTSYWQEDPSKNNTMQPPISIAQTLCPNLCSGHGKCINASCICQAGYTSADCSIDKGRGPTVQSVPLKGLCDIRKRKDCLQIRINGYDFMDSEKLSCRATEIKVWSFKNMIFQKEAIINLVLHFQYNLQAGAIQIRCMLAVFSFRFPRNLSRRLTESQSPGHIF